MTDSTAESILTTNIGLLTYYCYEVGSQGQESLLNHWLGDYSPEWVRLALIESLYRGRYKTISVGGLLADWKRKGQPTYHFNREFEALICHKFPQIKFNQEYTVPEPSAMSRSLGIDKAQDVEPFATPLTAETTENLDQRIEESLSELNSKGVESRMNPALNSKATPISNRLWSFVAETVVDQTLSSRSKEHFHPSLLENNFDTTSQKAERNKKPQKSEVSPIDQFVPNQEISEHYQKLVQIVSNRPTSYRQNSSQI